MHALRWVIRSVCIEPPSGTSPPGGEDRFATEPPWGEDRYRLKTCFLVAPYSLGHCLVVALPLLGICLAMWQHAWRIAWPSLGLRSVLLGIPLGRASGPGMLERLL